VLQTSLVRDTPEEADEDANTLVNEADEHSAVDEPDASTHEVNDEDANTQPPPALIFSHSRRVRAMAPSSPPALPRRRVRASAHLWRESRSDIHNTNTNTTTTSSISRGIPASRRSDAETSTASQSSRRKRKARPPTHARMTRNTRRALFDTE
jgi:hypothetical protein